jgi:hypothetical protein
MEINIARSAKPYNFKHIECNAEAVFIKGNNIKLYKLQNCEKCGHCSIGYYCYIRKPQYFKCVICLYEWSICTKDQVNKKMDLLEESLYILDNALDNVFKLTGELKC